MKISRGLFEHMLMQRNKNNVCEQIISGSSLPGSQIRGTDANGKELFTAACDKNGDFQALLTGWKSGGPYALTLSDGNEELHFSDLWVGDLWMLAGQSNMQGIAKLENPPRPTPKIRALYMDDRWDIAKEPLHDMRNAKAEIHWIFNGGHDAFRNQTGEMVKGAGPGLFFAKEMLKRTRIPQGLIASAHGGTTMEQWDPALRDKGEYSLYGAMYERFLNSGGKVAGLLWYQGCSDTTSAETVALYEQRTLDLFKAVRRDFNYPDLPIVMVQLGRTMEISSPEKDFRWSRIRDIQRKLPQKLSHLQTVPAIDLETDDSIHLSCAGHRILSSRIADSMELILGNKKVPAQIEVGKISCRFVEKYKEYQITINFKNVVGGLICQNTIPLGFTIHNADLSNTIATPPYRCEVRKKSIVIYTGMTLREKIAFAFGCNPGTNIHDEAGRSLPAFGPLFIRPVPRSTAMLCSVEVSRAIMGDDSFESLLPDAEHLKNVSFEKYKDEASIYILPPRIVGKGAYHYYFRWQVNCLKDCRSIIFAGSDGPFRICCDGKEIAGFPVVENPILADEFSIPLELTAGKHEFTLGMSGKSGNAWGFCLRYADPDDILTDENENDSSDALPQFI
jgi:sialate O-acetylesterase